MTSRLLVLACAALLMAATGRSALAHHGGAAYDQTTFVTVKGTMTELQFANPHVLLFFDVVNEKGEKENWSGWLTAPTKLQRAGWNRNTLKPGDTVEVTGRPHKAGQKVIQIRKLIAPDGKELPLFED
jgi:hypothetical protein